MITVQISAQKTSLSMFFNDESEIIDCYLRITCLRASHHFVCK